MGIIKKGWGNDFHFFNFLSKILFPKKLLSPFFRQSQSVWVLGTGIGWGKNTFSLIGAQYYQLNRNT